MKQLVGVKSVYMWQEEEKDPYWTGVNIVLSVPIGYITATKDGVFIDESVICGME